MKNVSTGAGLCVLGLCIVGYPLVERISTRAEAGVPAAGAVVAAALAQDPPAPTIVWYGVSQGDNTNAILYRAWSDGRVEGLAVVRSFPQCGAEFPTLSPCGAWKVLAYSSQGLTFDADLNSDQAVDGDDLGALLAKWGPAPRNPVPPSDCPLALINP